MMHAKKEWFSLIIGFSGAALGLYGVASFNRYMLMSLPMELRMISMPIVYWLIALIPVIITLIYKDTDLGFSKSGIGLQIITGVLIGAAMSFAFTLVPHWLGLGAHVDTGKRYQYVWQFVYEFIYCIAAIGFVEEYVFRGFIYDKIKKISQKDATAVIGSSILFGAFHIFSGNLVQMVMTSCLGILWCLCRLKIKNCSTLSLIIAHGVYDALITFWASLLL